MGALRLQRQWQFSWRQVVDLMESKLTSVTIATFAS
jgi:hypothetical protein